MFMLKGGGICSQEWQKFVFPWAPGPREHANAEIRRT